MKMLTLTAKEDGKAFRWLAQSVYAPFIDPGTGHSSMRVGGASERLAASVELVQALNRARLPSIEPPALRAGEVEIVLAESAWGLLTEHWTTYWKFLPPVLAEDISEVNALLDRVATLTPEEYAAKKVAEHNVAGAKKVSGAKKVAEHKEGV